MLRQEMNKLTHFFGNSHQILSAIFTISLKLSRHDIGNSNKGRNNIISTFIEPKSCMLLFPGHTTFMSRQIGSSEKFSFPRSIIFVHHVHE